MGVATPEQMVLVWTRNTHLITSFLSQLVLCKFWVVADTDQVILLSCLSSTNTEERLEKKKRKKSHIKYELKHSQVLWSQGEPTSHPPTHSISSECYRNTFLSSHSDRREDATNCQTMCCFYRVCLKQQK